MDDLLALKTIGEDDEVDIESSSDESSGDEAVVKGFGASLGMTADDDDDDDDLFPHRTGAGAGAGAGATAAADSDSDSDSDSDAGVASGAEAASGGSGSEASDAAASGDSDSDDDNDSDSDDASDSDGEVARGPVKKKKAPAAPTTRVKDIKVPAKPKKAAKAAELAPLSKIVDANRTFAQLHLSRPLLRAVADMHYSTPTDIQWKAVPVALAGQDVCGSAQTGSGKTAAFLLPALERLLFRDKRMPAIRVLVVLPTRELASQCHYVCQQLTKYTDIRCALAVGGLSLKVQEAELRTRPDVVIGTPGRLLDHAVNSVAVYFDNIDILVLDEADRLLEMGFTEEVQELVKACPVERQTLFFSATMTSKVEELAKFTLKKPVKVSVNPMFDVTEQLSQEFVRVRKAKENEREAMLLALLMGPFPTEVIVFFETKVQAHRMMIMLTFLGVRAGELHGNLSQQQRLDAMADFRDSKVDVLCATDLAGRGLDIASVKAVINFEMPRELTTYVHRVGRTARAGRKGHALTLTGEHRRALMKDVVKHAKGSVKSRTIAPEEIEKWKTKLRALQPDYYARLKEERVEKEARLAEMEANKATNLITHAEDIVARPARSWFQSETQKQVLKTATREAAETAAADLSKLSAKDRKALRNASHKADKKAAKVAAKKSDKRMTRDKRRRAAVLEDRGHTMVAAKAAARFAKKQGRKEVFKGKKAKGMLPSKGKPGKGKRKRVRTE